MPITKLENCTFINCTHVCAVGDFYFCKMHREKWVQLTDRLGMTELDGVPEEIIMNILKEFQLGNGDRIEVKRA